ncbi:phospholipase A1-IIgamma-like [Ziziphus jujuba]|uniref:Phospholipase A1 n=2 Tax=Ziziphus jujuba TaxID=326968 RepID=A0ABM4ABE8_ZIZJJ|nr:phospholipase A1-IIgamma-like [Ziziphus jujuba]KAH7514222.1 hypothetical protein FEM48_Zijuj11G0065900 [Ziziphus jujuba var. spinosa]
MDSKILLGATCLLFILAGFNCDVKNYAAKADIQKVDIGSIAKRWRNLSGEYDWDGLLDPLDVDLRSYIIHYGDRIQAILDSFISDKRSRNIGLPRYIKKHFFSKVGLVNGNPYDYEVVRYLYASTLDSRSPQYPVPPENVAGYSNWVGYVAVSTDYGSVALGRRDIVIAIRGTTKDEEWYLKYLLELVPASDIFGTEYNPKLQKGRYVYYVTADPGSAFNSISFRDQVLSTVRELVDKYKDEEVSITVTGHSMGGAFVTIIASDIAYNGYNKPTNQTNIAFPVTGFAIANSPVGDEGFVKVYNTIENLHILRIANLNDSNPDFPNSTYGYYHVGTKLVIDSLQSPYLKDAINTVHQLQVYLHTIAGTQGSAGGFKLEVDRDLVLLNKALDAVKDSYNITARWWGEKNKNFVQLDNGTWVVDIDREIDEYEPLSSTVTGKMGLCSM